LKDPKEIEGPKGKLAQSKGHRGATKICDGLLLTKVYRTI
jgi:hypothetical protein